MTKKALPIIVCVFLLATDVAPQEQRRRGRARPPATKQADVAPVAESKSAATAPAERVAPVLLATVNGQNITTSDIDPQVRQEVDGLGAKIAEARKTILETEINTLLLASEAAKRKTTPQQLFDLEVTRKVSQPSTSEVNKFIEDNRVPVNQAEPAEMRQQVVEVLMNERAAALSEQLVKRLRASTPVIQRADLNSPSLTPATVLATVGGFPITAGPIIERLKPVLYKMRMTAYLMEKEALDRTINDLLLLAEANRRNVPPEAIVRADITDKLQSPTEADVANYYAENKARLNGEFDALRNSIANYLHEQERQRLERELSDRLRKDASIRIFITEPAQPVQLISVDDDPALGSANAPVTIVEFTDFQCPSCAAMHPVIDELLKSYAGRVRLVVRDFPMPGHANARKAAEAANAANAEGKFFEYAALLYKHQKDLDVPSLKKYASELGLNRAKFDAALDRGTYAVEVRKDIAEGQMYGIEGTPAIFVNGVALRVFSGDGLRALIDKALAGSGNSRPTSR
jgi:protein-disulfide isomerase